VGTSWGPASRRGLYLCNSYQWIFCTRPSDTVLDILRGTRITLVFIIGASQQNGSHTVIGTILDLLFVNICMK
jgi:hypothetical protein